MLRWRRIPWAHLGALLGYVLLAVAVTWPLAEQVTTHFAGDDVDVWMNQWADWWTEKALRERLAFYYTDYLFYPQGTSLVFHSFTHVNTAISLLLAPLIGHLAAYNITIYLAYVLSGFGMYLLVEYLTGCRAAAFVAGLVFAFHPYHIYESVHPVLVTTQWIPLFVLALIRMLRETGSRRFKHLLLAALWFVLNALSSWHLMTFLAVWIALYLVYGSLFERTEWAPGASRYLLLLSVIIGLAMLPLLWPILREHLTADAAYMGVDVEQGLANDLLSFLLPSNGNPVLGSLVSDIRQRVGPVRIRPSYLGCVPLALAVVGAASSRRTTRFWWIAGFVFLLLSLGPQIRWCGTPLHAFRLPWAGAVVGLWRHPFRFDLLLLFSLSVLVGFGARSVWLWTVPRGRPIAGLTLVLLAGFLLLEYAVRPFPTMRPRYSPFLDRLAEEEGEFAVADFPMGRQQAKHHMFYQTIHGHRIADGHVSRTPHDAYAFVDANPLLGSLRAGIAPDARLGIEEELATLASQGIRYIILHKHLLKPGEQEAWRKRLAGFPPTYYEDEWLIAYRTEPMRGEVVTYRLDVRLGDHIRLRGYRLSGDSLSAGDVVKVVLLWETDGSLAGDYHVFVHFQNAGGMLAAQHDGVPVHGTHPTWSWEENEAIEDEHAVMLARDLPEGTYTLSVGMYDYQTKERLPAVGAAGERLPDDRVVLQGIRVASP